MSEEAPLPLWRIEFDGMTDKETVVLEAKTRDEAIDTANDLFLDPTNLKVTPTERHFPE